MIEKKGAIPSEVVEKSATLHTASFTPHPQGSGLSEEKQIEDMARAMCRLSNNLKCGECSEHCFFKDYAKKAFDKGYRSPSEGRWKKRGNEKTCSLCKFIYYSNNDEWNYCPNCGAKMKGESK